MVDHDGLLFPWDTYKEAGHQNCLLRSWETQSLQGDQAVVHGRSGLIDSLLSDFVYLRA